MVMLEPDFVYGVVRRSLLLGLLAAVVTFFAVSAKFAEAVAIGTVVSSINIRVMALSIQKMLEAGRDGQSSANVWGFLLVAKMFVLIAVIWVLVAYVNVDAIGFVFGFSLFMPAIGWQMLVTKPNGSEEDSEV